MYGHVESQMKRREQKLQVSFLTADGYLKCYDYLYLGI